MTDDELKAHFAGQALIAVGHLFTYERVIRMREDPVAARDVADTCWRIAEAMLDARPPAVLTEMTDPDQEPAP